MKGFRKDFFESNASSIDSKTLRANKRKNRKAEQHLKQM